MELERVAGTRLELAVTTAEALAVAGSISLSGFHARNHAAMVSYWLSPGGRGRGLATGAVRLLAGWAFDVLGQHRLALHTEIENLASRRVAERSGFRREGRLRSYQQRRDGRRADVLVYGPLAGELG